MKDCLLKFPAIYLRFFETDMDFNILHLTDIHGAENSITEIGNEIQNADIVILSGDITHFGNSRDVASIIETISSFNKKIFAVSGNCDYKEVDNYLTEYGINLHRRVIETDRYTFCGLGGSLPCPGYTPFEYTDSEANSWLSEMKDKIKSKKPMIFVSHQPPSNTKNDRLTNGKHVGSISIRNFIQTTCPLLCLTGHIHEGTGIDAIENCQIINPGPFRTGKYASIKITGENSVNSTLRQITAF
jgi:Icc-related predicted phosphoesterase